jgi:hypothetical protein
MTSRLRFTISVQRLKDLIADYPDAPPGLSNFTWVTVPRYWDRLAIPGTAARHRGERLYVRPTHEDRHGGVIFSVGWDEPERFVALWIN